MASKKPKKHTPPGGLEILADFLNFSFDSEDPKELTDKSSYHMGTLFHLNLGKPEGIEEAKQLQAEILSDVTPILPPASVSKPEEAWGLLEDLIGKINRLDLRPEWHVDPVKYSLGGYDDIKTGELYLRFDEKSEDKVKETYRLLGPGQKVVEILGFDWIITTRVLGPGISSSRQALYSIIVDALESGQLSKLRRCLYCAKFFVAGEQGQKLYCSYRCMKAADQANAAKKRVPQYRRRKRTEKELKAKAKEKEAKQAADERAFERFSDFMKVAGKNKHTDSERLKIQPILKILGDGTVSRGWNTITRWQKSGKNLTEVWMTLSCKEKKLFTEQPV